MEELVKKLVKNFTDFFAELDAVRKIGLISLTALIIGVLSGILSWASKTEYEVLFTELNKEDSSKVARLLEEKKIPYLVDNNGKTLKVPKEQVPIWRLELAKSGMSFSGTVGYEVFDKQSFGTSSFVQRVNKQRALEGELIRTIRYMDGVKRARVHLSIPESSPFVSERKPPSASVVLDLERGVILTPSEVKGIQTLVSSSIDSMRSHNVVIIDSKGKKLSENIGDEMTAHTANRIALESRINRQFETQIEDILSKVTGEGKVIAKVNAKMDFTESVSTETKYDQEGAAILSEVKNKQKLVGSRPSPQGIPGARSNLPGETPQPGIPETKNDVDKDLSTKNYNVPSVITKSKKPTARLMKLSAAVMIDGKYVPMLDEQGNPVLGEDGIPKKQYEQWSEEELANFSEIVASAIGLNLDRGDKLTIRNMEFAKEDLAAIEAVMQQRENRALMRNLAKYIAIGLAMTLFFIFVVRPFIQWVTENAVESVEDFLPKTIEELEKIQAQQKLPGLEDVMPQMDEVINPEKLEGNMLKEKIRTLVDANPAKAAQVLSFMIHSSDGGKAIA